MGDSSNYVIFTPFLRKPERHPNDIWTPFERHLNAFRTGTVFYVDERFRTGTVFFMEIRFFSWNYGFFHGGISQNLKIFWEPQKTWKFMKIYDKSQKRPTAGEKNIQKPIIEPLRG